MLEEGQSVILAAREDALHYDRMNLLPEGTTMKPLECVDFNCDGRDQKGRCQMFWTCLVRLADHLAYLAMVFLGGCFFIGVGLVVNAGHAEPAVMTLVTTLTGIFGGIIYTIRQRLDRVEDKRAMQQVADRVEAKDKKIDAIEQKLDPITSDVKAARVASKVAVQQNVDLDIALGQIAKNVNGGKEKAEREAYEKGRADEVAKQDSKF